ncbi:RepB family plasmid replication initiator protein [Alkalihalobacillus oceani]|uniref:RepB family plasmid replication initiator protein n=1 Tax=Halalkalibacter oceani TaxID=1653776 RepID=A0A9X2IRM1_9BACI|nr:RepB family plasmid replication initiator protein [Halalkalibacter oceani]MCM3716587.1 RepB family plasmid replication initiator protein [Halalkalibacter oceani]
MKGISITKPIQQVLDKIEAEYEIHISAEARDDLLERYIKPLRRQKTHNLQRALLSIKEKSFNYIESNNDYYKLLLFQQEILEESIASRRIHGKKMPVERAYAESPIFTASSPSSKAIIELKNEDGEIVEKRVGYRTIEYKSKHGYLTTGDFRIFGGLQRMWELKGGSKKFSFSYNELCDVIDYSPEGGNYRTIEKSILKLSSTSITFEEFLDAELTNRDRIKVQNIIQSADIGKRNAEITFSDRLHEGLQQGNVVRLNLSIFHDLSSVTAKLLYSLLSSLLEKQKILDLDMLINQLGIQNNSRKDVIKTIREALDDLVQSGVIYDYQLLRKGRSFKEVELLPSEQLLEALEEGITVSEI